MKDKIERAVAILRSGGLVVFPTETVYGLGADANNPDAITKIFVAKGRPQNHPVIVHLPSPSHLSHWASNVPEAAHRLAKAYWPGPLTLVLPRKPGVSDLITGGQDTVGLRVPNHPVALELLRAFGSGIAAPSANRFGRLSPTTAGHVRDELGDSVDLIVDGGPCDVGIESTIVDLSRDAPALLRPGEISRRDIERTLMQSLTTQSSTRVPGSLPAHYAPRTPVRVVSFEEIADATANQKNVAVVSMRAVASRRSIQAAEDARTYAHDLYAHLRALDQMGCETILVESVPDGEEWTAIRDRLTRAAASSRRS